MEPAKSASMVKVDTAIPFLSANLGLLLSTYVLSGISKSVCFVFVQNCSIIFVQKWYNAFLLVMYRMANL